jgi:arylsulfatase A-like enzyme
MNLWKNRILALVLLPVLALSVSSCRKEKPGTTDLPNIIVLTVDTLRADHTPMYGYHRDTMPSIRSFTETAVLFDQAVIPRGNTRASYASMLTGLYPFHHGIYNNNFVLHEDLSTLPEMLKPKGYHTAFFVSNFVLVGELSGCDQGFDVYDDRLEDRELNRTNYERSAAGTLKAILQWLENEPPEPFFLMVNLIDPHGPYMPPERFREMYKSKEKRILDRRKIFSYQMVDGSLDYYDYLDRYDAEIRYVDEAFGKLIEELKSKQLWDKAFVVFLSDHGEALGEHNVFFEHQYNVFEETVRVPLAIRLPLDKDAQNIVKPRRVSSLGSPMDLMPTILDYLDIPFDGMMDGQSLLPVIEGAENDDRMIFLEFPEVSIPTQSNPAAYAVRTSTHKLMRFFQPNTEKLIGEAVFDVIADPLEQKVIKYDDGIELHRRMSKQLDDMLKQAREYEFPYTLTSYDVPLTKRTEYVEQRKKKFKTIVKPLSEEQIEKLRSLGYVD